MMDKLDRRSLLARLALLGATPHALAVMASCSNTAKLDSTRRARSSSAPTPYANGAVAADHEIASRIGVDILRAGGNAVDAAIAVNAALGVVRPYSCGLGGGGFMVMYAEESGEAWAMNARETAPPGVWESYYIDLRSSGGPEAASRYGGHAIAVPGTPSGLFLAHRAHGSLPMKQLLAPAARVAREGFEADANFVGAVERTRKIRTDLPWTKTISSWVWSQWCHDGAVVEGTHVANPALGATLERLGEEGMSAWRTGPIAKSLARAARNSGSKLTETAIAGYRAQALAPLVIEDAFDGETYIMMPPPSSGGIAMAQILGMTEDAFQRAGTPTYGSPEATHALVEAMKIAFANRAQYLADPAFAPVPIDWLLERERIRENWGATIELDRARPAEEVAQSRQLPDDSGTSHFSVIDRARTAVAWTSTINGIFGSLVGDPESGVVLNNEMDDFTTTPGEGNLFDLQQSNWNSPVAGKYPLSSMSPTIVVDADGRVRALAGASGGPRIISGTVQVLLGMRYGGLTAEEALAAPRIHHQWQPDVLRHEAFPAHANPEQRLRALGHQLDRRNSTIGVVQAIRVEDTGFEPASDPRKGGKAAGY